MKSFKKSLVLLPLSLLVLSSVAPVAAKADSWGSKEHRNFQKIQDDALNQLPITDKMLETIAAGNEQNIINYINSEINYVNSNNDSFELSYKSSNLDTLNRYKKEAQDACNLYNGKINKATDKFTGDKSYYQDFLDSEADIDYAKYFPNITTSYEGTLYDVTYNSKIYPDGNKIYEYLQKYQDKQQENQMNNEIDNNPGDIVPNTTQVQSMISSAVSSNNNNDSDAKAIASLQAEVAKLEKEVSGQKKSSSHAKTLAADKKQLAKINKELHQKHLGKKAHHKLVLQRKALLKAIKKLVK